VTYGVVVMAYGTPAGPDDIEAYYTHIRRGRPPTPELLADLRRRYDAIGGVSPLAARTEAQRGRLASFLPGVRIELGQKHAPPFIEDAVAALDAVDHIVGLVLAPHYSRGSVGEYHERLRAAAEVPVATIASWHLEPALIDFLAAEVKAGAAALPAPVTVLFTAHSLPLRVVADGDPYEVQLRESATAIAAAAAGVDAWDLAWQSAGRTGDEWLGPDIRDVIPTLDTASVLVCPQGFTADHLEVLYDLDVDAAAAARAAGIAFARTRSVNDDPSVFAALAGRVAAARP
jgi:ferrochelatase